IDKNVVYRVLAKHYRPASGGSGPSWLSFIGYATDSLWSVDLFRCESIVLQTYWVLVVMDQFTRRLVGVGVHRGVVTGADVCRMFNAAIHGQSDPRHLSTDHEPLFEAHRWRAKPRIIEIDEIKTVPHVPLSHPFVERLIGTMRREFLDHVLFWNARDLERKLAAFRAYYNAARSHAALEGHTPLTFGDGHTGGPADRRHVQWVSHCRGLVQLPAAPRQQIRDRQDGATGFEPGSRPTRPYMLRVRRGRLATSVVRIVKFTFDCVSSICGTAPLTVRFSATPARPSLKS